MDNQTKIAVAVSVVAVSIALYMYKKNMDIKSQMDKIKEQCKEANEANAELSGVLQQMSSDVKKVEQKEIKEEDEE
jgi:cell division protein FtsL|tara:strand:+ start:385 stop:612 length:228 start_codon:yes stop_codon:yes gene_type:complete